MSRAAPRPPVVQRYLRRPLLWAVVVAGLCAASILGDLQAEQHIDRGLDDGFAADATVASDYGGGDRIPLTYDNPLTGRTETRAERWGADRPEPGATVAVDVDRDDPRRVALAGHRYRAEPVTFYVAFPLALVLAWVVRRRWCTRLERLIAAPGPSFLMFGSLTGSGGRFRRAAKLNLFPVDAAPGRPAVCSVRLLSAEGLPVGGPAFKVEVKGSPRAFGQLIARVDGTVLWPRGRALGHTSRRRPGAETTPATYPGTDVPDVPPYPPWWSAPALRAPFAVLAVTLGVAGLVTALTLAGRSAERDLERRGTRVVAQVTDTRDDREVEVAYRSPGDERLITGRAATNYDGDIDEGERYPAVVDPDSPDRVHLLAVPYDVSSPLISGWLPAVAAGLWLAWRLLWWHRGRTAARRGPWVEADAWIQRPARAGRDVEVALAPPGSPTPSCSLLLPAATLPPGTLAGSWTSWPPTPAAAPAAAWTPPPGAPPFAPGPPAAAPARHRVAVAGTPSPGEAVTLLLAHRLVAPQAPAHAPRSSP